MFCPKCSEPKTADKTQYCTKCGFDLSGLNAFVQSGGSKFSKSRRQKGIEQGTKLILLGVMLIPVWMFIGPAFPPNDRLVESSPSTTWLEQIPWILMWIALLAGAARIAFALIFEHANEAATPPATASGTDTNPANATLPGAEAFHPADPGGWKTTDELFEPILRKSRTSGEL